MNFPNNGLENKVGTFLLLRENEKTLMLNRDADPSHFMYGKWTPPGGKFNPNETPEECVVREFFEETGLSLREIKYRGLVFFDNKNRYFGGKPAKFNFIVYVFEAYSYTGTLNPKCNEGSLHWIEDSKLRSLNLEKGDPYVFDLLDQKIPLNHRIILSDDDAKIEPLI